MPIQLPAISRSGSNLTGSQNTSTGTSSIATSDGKLLTSVGAYAQQQASTGPEGENVSVGTYALYNNRAGVFCTAIGSYSLYYNYGKSNTATGYRAMYGTGVNGSDNTAFGANTLTLMIANSEGNTAFGSNALINSGAGAYNTAAGYATLYHLNDTKYNTAIGYGAGIGYDISHANTILGANCDVGADGITNSIAIGQQVVCTASNQVRIGNLATNSIGGQVGWSTLSDGRFKKNIREDVKGLDFILRLKPVTYRLDMDILARRLRPKGAPAVSAAMRSDISANGQRTLTGFVAQDVEKAAQEAGFSFSGVDKPATEDGLYGLRYDDFVVPLVKAVQEQQRQIEALQKGNVEADKRIRRIQEKIGH
ncbi:tail fiber domain-containing protein [Puia sp. P3]|uniref:tail fiber domain-containing protein n=1 Tax=Puia sp. P3 TaxID=3423952 RepID=UPI003D670418